VLRQSVTLIIINKHEKSNCRSSRPGVAANFKPSYYVEIPFRQDRFALERMRILLDENIPRGLRRILQGHDVRTASEMGWASIANGQLLDEAEKAGFEALVTSDQNFVFQQNLAGRNIAVVVLSTNRWATIRVQPQTVQRAVANASPGTFSRVTLSGRQRRPRPAPDLRC
jgi:predicted nuclease of predicted toxin-antitoxin system